MEIANRLIALNLVARPAIAASRRTEPRRRRGHRQATRLSEVASDAVDVTLLDRNDSFFFGFSKLEVMLGRQSADEVRLPYRDIAKDGVEFRQETVVLAGRATAPGASGTLELFGNPYCRAHRACA